MNKIFIEAKNKSTSEYHFIKTIIDTCFQGKEIDFIFMDGIGNLFKEAILNQISQALITGDQAIVLADADTVAKGYGYVKRKKEIEKGMHTNNISFSYFLYPDNQHDGEVECLMESTARRDLHQVFFDRFADPTTNKKTGNSCPSPCFPFFEYLQFILLNQSCHSTSSLYTAAVSSAIVSQSYLDIS